MTPPLTPIPHDAFVADVTALAAAIAAGDWRPDRLVGIARGGLVPATYLSHALALPMTALDPAEDAAVERLVASGERLLIVDDINDSGRTIAALRARLGSAEVRVAVLIDNRGSIARVDYAARTIDRAETPDWFVFPWEAMAPAGAAADEASAHQAR